MLSSSRPSKRRKILSKEEEKPEKQQEQPSSQSQRDPAASTTADAAAPVHRSHSGAQQTPVHREALQWTLKQHLRWHMKRFSLKPQRLRIHKLRNDDSSPTKSADRRRRRVFEKATLQLKVFLRAQKKVRKRLKKSLADGVNVAAVAAELSRRIGKPERTIELLDMATERKIEEFMMRIEKAERQKKEFMMRIEKAEREQKELLGEREELLREGEELRKAAVFSDTFDTTKGIKEAEGETGDTIEATEKTRRLLAETSEDPVGEAAPGRSSDLGDADSLSSDEEDEAESDEEEGMPEVSNTTGPMDQARMSVASPSLSASDLDGLLSMTPLEICARYGGDTEWTRWRSSREHEALAHFPETLGYPDLFAPARFDSRLPVEVATAHPGRLQGDARIVSTSSRTGVVYRQRLFGRDVAVKCLFLQNPRSSDVDPRTVSAELSNEARIYRTALASFGKGRTPEFYWHGDLQSGVIQALVQSFVPGKPMSSPEHAARALQTLDDLHEHGVLHGDVRRANFIVADLDDSIVVLDFGFAKLRSDPEFATDNEAWVKATRREKKNAREAFRSLTNTLQKA